MQNSRLPKIIFALLALYAAVHFSSVYPRLPNVVASHFNGRGAPNGWQTRQAFFSVFIGVGVLATMIGLVIPRIIAAAPAQLINLPNKSYWLAPEHRQETIDFLNAHFAWFGCGAFLLLLLTFDYAIQSNLHPENPPAPARMWYILGGFLASCVLSTIRLLAKFLSPPQTSQGAKP